MIAALAEEQRRCPPLYVPISVIADDQKFSDGRVNAFGHPSSNWMAISGVLVFSAICQLRGGKPSCEVLLRRKLTRSGPLESRITRASAEVGQIAPPTQIIGKRSPGDCRQGQKFAPRDLGHRRRDFIAHAKADL